VNTTSEIKIPTTPTSINTTPNLKSLNPCCWTTADHCAVVARYTIAPTTVETALNTTPHKPMASPLMLKSLFVALATARTNVPATQIPGRLFRLAEDNHERLRNLKCFIEQ
jgi:hypothetical protein